MQPPADAHAATTARRRTLDPKLDIVFWMLLSRERNRALLTSLLEAVLKPAAPITSVEVLGSEPDKEAPGDKDIVLDLRVALTGGEQVDIEMQTRWHPGLRERILFYWARLYAGQLARGSDYTALRRSIVILFADFSTLSGSRFHSTFRAREDHGGELLTDQLEVHVLELPKLRTAVDRDDEPSLAGWCKFLSAESDEELEEVAMQHPALKQAKEALEELSADPHARVRAEQREMSQIAYDLTMSAALAEGEAKGRAEAILTVLAARQIAITTDERFRIESTRDPATLVHWLSRAATARQASEIFE